MPERSICAEQEAKWWTPLWDQQLQHERIAKFQDHPDAVQGLSTQEVIKNTAKQLNRQPVT
jgi:hypothetical protein